MNPGAIIGVLGVCCLSSSVGWYITGSGESGDTKTETETETEISDEVETEILDEVSDEIELQGDEQIVMTESPQQRLVRERAGRKAALLASIAKSNEELAQKSLAVMDRVNRSNAQREQRSLDWDNNRATSEKERRAMYDRQRQQIKSRRSDVSKLAGDERRAAAQQKYDDKRLRGMLTSQKMIRRSAAQRNAAINSTQNIINTQRDSDELEALAAADGVYSWEREAKYAAAAAAAATPAAPHPAASPHPAAREGATTTPSTTTTGKLYEKRAKSNLSSAVQSNIDNYGALGTYKRCLGRSYDWLNQSCGKTKGTAWNNVSPILYSLSDNPFLDANGNSTTMTQTIAQHWVANDNGVDCTSLFDYDLIQQKIPITQNGVTENVEIYKVPANKMYKTDYPGAANAGKDRYCPPLYYKVVT